MWVRFEHAILNTAMSRNGDPVLIFGNLNLAPPSPVITIKPSAFTHLAENKGLNGKELPWRLVYEQLDIVIQRATGHKT
jgi:hypothetical protein